MPRELAGPGGKSFLGYGSLHANPNDLCNGKAETRGTIPPSRSGGISHNFSLPCHLLKLPSLGAGIPELS